MTEKSKKKKKKKSKVPIGPKFEVELEIPTEPPPSAMDIDLSTVPLPPPPPSSKKSKKKTDDLPPLPPEVPLPKPPSEEQPAESSHIRALMNERLNASVPTRQEKMPPMPVEAPQGVQANVTPTIEILYPGSQEGLQTPKPVQPPVSASNDGSSLQPQPTLGSATMSAGLPQNISGPQVGGAFMPPGSVPLPVPPPSAGIQMTGVIASQPQMLPQNLISSQDGGVVVAENSQGDTASQAVPNQAPQTLNISLPEGQLLPPQPVPAPRRRSRFDMVHPPNWQEGQSPLAVPVSAIQEKLTAQVLPVMPITKTQQDMNMQNVNNQMDISIKTDAKVLQSKVEDITTDKEPFEGGQAAQTDGAYQPQTATETMEMSIVAPVENKSPSTESPVEEQMAERRVEPVGPSQNENMNVNNDLADVKEEYMETENDNMGKETENAVASEDGYVFYENKAEIKDKKKQEKEYYIPKEPITASQLLQKFKEKQQTKGPESVKSGLSSIFPVALPTPMSSMSSPKTETKSIGKFTIAIRQKLKNLEDSKEETFERDTKVVDSMTNKPQDSSEKIVIDFKKIEKKKASSEGPDLPGKEEIASDTEERVGPDFEVKAPEPSSTEKSKKDEGRSEKSEKKERKRSRDRSRDRSRERSRDRSRERSRDRSRSYDRDWKPRDTYRDRRSREDDYRYSRYGRRRYDDERYSNRYRNYGSFSRNHSRYSKERDRSLERNRSRDRDRSWERSRQKDKKFRDSRSRDRSESKSRRSRSKERKSREKTSRKVSRSEERSVSKDRSLSTDKRSKERKRKTESKERASPEFEDRSEKIDKNRSQRNRSLSSEKDLSTSVSKEKITKNEDSTDISTSVDKAKREIEEIRMPPGEDITKTEEMETSNSEELRSNKNNEENSESTEDLGKVNSDDKCLLNRKENEVIMNVEGSLIKEMKKKDDTEKMEIDNKSDIETENESSMRDTLLEEGMKVVERDRQERRDLKTKEVAESEKMKYRPKTKDYGGEREENKENERMKYSDKRQRSTDRKFKVKSPKEYNKEKLLKHVDYSSDSDSDTGEISQTKTRMKSENSKPERSSRMAHKDVFSVKEGRFQRMEKDMTKSKWDSSNESDNGYSDDRNQKRYKHYSPPLEQPPHLKKESLFPISVADKSKHREPETHTEKQSVKEYSTNESDAESDDENLGRSRKKEKEHKKKIKKDKKKEDSDSDEEQMLSKKKKKKKDKKKKKIKGDMEDEEEPHKKIKDKKKSKKKVRHNSSEIGYMSGDDKDKIKSKKKEKYPKAEEKYSKADKEERFLEVTLESRSKYDKKDSRRKDDSGEEMDMERRFLKERDTTRKKDVSEDSSFENESSDAEGRIRKKDRKEQKRKEESRYEKEMEQRSSRRRNASTEEILQRNKKGQGKSYDSEDSSDVDRRRTKNEDRKSSKSNQNISPDVEKIRQKRENQEGSPKRRDTRARSKSNSSDRRRGRDISRSPSYRRKKKQTDDTDERMYEYVEKSSSKKSSKYSKDDEGFIEEKTVKKNKKRQQVKSLSRSPSSERSHSRKKRQRSMSSEDEYQKRGRKDFHRKPRQGTSKNMPRESRSLSVDEPDLRKRSKKGLKEKSQSPYHEKKSGDRTSESDSDDRYRKRIKGEGSKRDSRSNRTREASSDEDTKGKIEKALPGSKV